MARPFVIPKCIIFQTLNVCHVFLCSDSYKKTFGCKNASECSQNTTFVFRPTEGTKENMNGK